MEEEWSRLLTPTAYLHMWGDDCAGDCHLGWTGVPGTHQELTIIVGERHVHLRNRGSGYLTCIMAHCDATLYTRMYCSIL